MAIFSRPILGVLFGASLLVPVLVLAASAATDGGLGRGPAGGMDSSNVVAQAGPITLGESDIRALVADLPATERAAVTTNLDSLEQVVHADLVRRAILTEATSSGFDHQTATVTLLDRARDEALVRLWVAAKSSVPSGYPSEAQIKSAYDANRQALTAPTQYRLAQIFIAAPDGGDPGQLAEALRKVADVATKIKASDFGLLARQLSDDSASASRAGDLGYLAANRMVPEILNAVRNLQPGQVVGPIKTAKGLHFLKLLDRKEGAVPTLAQVHDGLASALRTERANQLERAYLDSYSAKLGVTVNQIALAKLQQTLPR